MRGTHRRASEHSPDATTKRTNAFLGCPFVQSLSIATRLTDRTGPADELDASGSERLGCLFVIARDQHGAVLGREVQQLDVHAGTGDDTGRLAHRAGAVA